MNHKKFSKEHAVNLEKNLLDLESGTIDFYIDEVRYSPKLDQYYVLMLHEYTASRLEFHLKLDWNASTPPAIETEVDAPFHANDFPELLYKDS